jgi:hypothetical protein
MPRRSRSPALSNSQRHACSATDVPIPYPKGRLQGRPSRCTPGMGSSLGCESPVEEMTLTTSQRQLRHREVAWEGSPRRSRDLRDTNRIQGGAAVWASRQRTTKPVVIEGPQRKCGRCATKVAVLIRGDLHGCPGCPTNHGRRVGKDGRRREVPVRRGEVSRGHSRGGRGHEGPNAEPRRSPAVLVVAAMTVAKPLVEGPRRGDRRVKPDGSRRERSDTRRRSMP